MNSFVYDESRWPVVEVVAPRGTVTEFALTEHLSRLTTLLARKRRFGLILDIRGTHAVDVGQRDRLRRYVRDHLGDVRGLLLGVAFVADSPFHRAIIATVLWLARPVFATRVFSDGNAAHAWVLARASEASAALV